MNAIHWRPVAALPLLCSLSCDDECVRNYAATVFAPWRCDLEPTATRHVTRHLQWKIESESLWRAQSSRGQTLENADFRVLITQIEYGVMQELIAHLERDFFGLHGALLSKNGRAVLIIGPREAGKSTLSCALWRGGWQLHCDDFALIDRSNCAHSTARRVSLRESSRDLLGEPLWQRIEAAPSTFETAAGLLFHPHEVETNCGALSPPFPLCAVIFLGRRDANTQLAQIKLVTSSAVPFAVLPYSTLLIPAGSTELAPGQTNWGAALPRLASLAQSVAFYDLGRGPLDAMIAQIEKTVFAD